MLFNGNSSNNVTKKRSKILEAIMLALPIIASSAQAFEIDDGTSDVKMRWDNTIKYTSAWRLKDPDLAIANQNGAQPNADFGDLGFHKNQQINNRFDLLSEFDLSYKQDYGFRISGDTWHDSVYSKGNNNYPAGNPPNTQAAILGAPNNRLNTAAEQIMGQHAEIDDAFVHGKFNFGEQNLSLRAGKHTLLYGESLFLGNNAIAAAQGPVDAIKALSLPNAQFKEIAMPVAQVSANFAVTPTVSVGAYQQFQWKENRLPASGSYFSPADFVGAGNDLLLTPFGCVPAAPTNSPNCAAPVTLYPFANSTSLATWAGDLKGSNSGQHGMQVKFKIGDVDYGLYAAKYDDKTPIPVLNMLSAMTLGPVTPGGKFGGGVYNLMYAKNIEVYGGSFSTVFGETNVAGEISTRRNVPLVAAGDLIINSAIPNADNDENTPYARGNSLHLNLSEIALFSGNSIWGGASLVGEFAFNRLLDVSYHPAFNPAAFDPLNTTHTRDASFMRVVFTPEFFQVFPKVDLEVPMGVGYGISGRSAIVQLSPEHGGDFNIGVNATINRDWKAALTYTTFFGSTGSAPSPVGTPTQTYASYKQYYGDRDFIALTIQTSF